LDKEETIKNLEEVIINNKIDFFLFTPSIKTGISINQPYFDSCLTYCSSGGICVRELIQMLYRARNLKDKSFFIYCSFSRYKYIHNKSIEDIKFLKLREMKTINDFINSVQNFKYHTKEDIINFTNKNNNIHNTYFNLHLNNEYEKYNSSYSFFQNLIIQLKYIYGYNITFTFPSKDEAIVDEDFMIPNNKIPQYVFKFVEADLIQYNEVYKINNYKTIAENFIKNPNELLDVNIDTNYKNIDDSNNEINNNYLVKLKSLIYFEYNNESKDDINNIFNKYIDENYNNNIEFIRKGLKKILSIYSLINWKSNFFRKHYFFDGITNYERYDNDIYKLINKLDNINYYIKEYKKKQYNNIKYFLDGNIDKFVNNIKYNYEYCKNKINLSDNTYKNNLYSIMLLRTIKILDYDIRYEKYLTNKEFKTIIEALIIKNKNKHEYEYDYLDDLNNFFINVYDFKKIWDYDNDKIYDTIKDSIRIILEHINVKIIYVDGRNTTKDYDKFVIRIHDDFRTERPENIFIKTENVKRGRGNNVYLDKNNKKVYEYNKNYYSYVDFNLTTICKEYSEEIDENNKDKSKPLIKAYLEYSTNEENIYSSLLEKENNKTFEIITDNNDRLTIERILNTNDENNEELINYDELHDEEIEENDDIEYIEERDIEIYDEIIYEEFEDLKEFEEYNVI
jgi:hypothetical protein